MAREVAVRLECLWCGVEFNVWRILPRRGHKIDLTGQCFLCPTCESGQTVRNGSFPMHFLIPKADSPPPAGGKLAGG